MSGAGLQDSWLPSWDPPTPLSARPQVLSLRDGGGQGTENRGVEAREGWEGGRDEGGPGSPVATAPAQFLHRLAPAVPAFTCWETDL